MSHKNGLTVLHVHTHQSGIVGLVRRLHGLGYGVSDVTLQVDLLVGIGLINLEVDE